MFALVFADLLPPRGAGAWGFRDPRCIPKGRRLLRRLVRGLAWTARPVPRPSGDGRGGSLRNQSEGSVGFPAAPCPERARSRPPLPCKWTGPLWPLPPAARASGSGLRLHRRGSPIPDSRRAGTTGVSPRYTCVTPSERKPRTGLRGEPHPHAGAGRFAPGRGPGPREAARPAHHGAVPGSCPPARRPGAALLQC